MKNVSIGDFVIDQDGSCAKVLGMTKNSIYLAHVKKTEAGIDCTSWHEERDFIKRFKCGLLGYFEFINGSDYDTIKRYFDTKNRLTRVKTLTNNK